MLAELEEAKFTKLYLSAGNRLRKSRRSIQVSDGDSMETMSQVLIPQSHLENSPVVGIGEDH